MESTKKGKKTNSKKGKTLIKLIAKSDSESESSEHELSYYANDRVKLMKEVLKIIKPKKIKSMAPGWMKNLDIEEINSMLLEELLGISNKRLKCIFNGQKLDDDSSSTDPEEEQKPVDVISLDDITDDDFVIDLDSDNSSAKQRNRIKRKVKDEHKRKKIKKEKHEKIDKERSKTSDKGKTDEENLMSVLELLELQARARAIRSQLALENKQKAQLKESSNIEGGNSDNEAIIIESPKNIEIVITSSESENEDFRNITAESLDSQNTTTQINKQKKKEKNFPRGVNGDEQNEAESLTRENSPKIQKESEQRIIDTEVSNKTNSTNKENGQRRPSDDEVQSKSSKFSSVADSGEEINIEKETENFSKITKQSGNLVLVTNNKSQKYITNSSKSACKTYSISSSSDKVLDKTSNKKNYESEKRQLQVPNKSISENVNAESSNRISNTDPDSVLVSEEQSNVNRKVENHEGLKLYKNKELHYKNNSTDDGDGIVINVDQAEIECIISD